MDLMQQRLLEELRRRQAAAPAQAVDPSIVPLDMAPPPPVTPDTSVVPAHMAPPPPSSAVPDNSTWLTDLESGYLGLRNAGTAGAMVVEQTAANTNNNYGELPGQYVANLDADIADYQARIAASSNDAERMMLQDGLDVRLTERAGYAEIGASPEFQAEAARKTARADDYIDTIVGDRIPTMVGRQAEINALPQNPNMVEFNDAEGFTGALKALVNSDDPLSIIRTIGLNSLPNSAPSIAAGAVGQLVAGPAGAATGAGLTGAVTESASSASQGILQALADAGVDTKDPEAVKKFLADNNGVLREVYGDAALRGGIIGAFDALSGGLVGKLVGPTLKSGSRTARVGTVAAGAGIEAGTEGAGEAAAQLATTGEIKGPDVLAEMIGGAAIGAPSAAIQMGAEALRQKGETLAQTPLAPQPQPPVTGEIVPPDLAPPPPTAEATSTDVPAPDVTAASLPTEQVQPSAEPIPAAPVAAQAQGLASVESKPTDLPPNPRRSKVFTPDNEEIEVETSVVEADSLVSSDQPAYPQTLQPRDRDRAASEIQIEGIANNPNPARLDQSPESDRGAPIVGQDGLTVESGNGRVIGLRRGYERGTAEGYRAYVQANYPEAAGMKNPVIVRKRITDVNEQDFTVASNQSATLQMSAGENAKTDARVIDDGILVQYKGGEIGSSANRPMIRAFIAKLPKTAQNALTTKEGGLSIEGVRRFTSALFTRAYGESNLLSRLTENPDDDIRSVTNALADAAPVMAQVRGEIEAGRISPDVDIAPDLLAATQIMADMRKRDQSLKDYRDQKDAFAEPNSPATDAILDAFFATDGKRMVSRKAMQDFLSFYAEGAKTQRTDQATAPGIEPAPLKNKEELANAAAQKQRAADATESPRLLDAREGKPYGRRADARRSEEQRTNDDSGGPETFDDENDVSTEDQTKIERGGTTPAFEAASQSQDPSVFEGAYRDAGITPDEGVLMPPVARVNMLSKLLGDKFGVKVGRAAGNMKLRANDATDQLLDAYRGASMMMHVMGLPDAALGLGGSLNLTLEKFKGKYLGMYDGGTRTIHMPGRSNSFAHEWFHALDHFLRDKLTPLGESHLLTKNAQSEGLADPRTSLENAFVNLINKMFFDEAALAHKMMGLELTAAKVDAQGDPTKAALDASVQLEKLAAGNTRIRVKPSAYRADSQAYSPHMADYFGSVHEMAARAFEAFIAHKMEMAGAGASNFISKGEAAYLSDADRRLELTFPKALERMAIFDAFEEIFNHLRAAEYLGSGPVAERPPDTDLADPAFWTKFSLGMKTTNVAADIAAEFRIMANGLAKLALHPVATLKATTSALALNTGLANSEGKFSPKSAIMQVARSARWLVSSMRGFAKAHIKRAPPAAQEFLRYVMAPVMTDPGTGRDQRQTIEEVTERSVARASAEIMSALKANGVSENPTKADNDTLRALMYGENVPATAKMKAVAASLRRAMEKAYTAAVRAGIEMGYVEEKGYLPRVLNSGAVEDNRDGFVAKATEVYQIHFDNIAEDMGAADLLSLATSVSLKSAPMADPRNGPFAAELKTLRAAVKALRAAAKPTSALTAALDTAREALADVIRTPYAETSARSWMERVLVGDGATFDSLGPDANFKQTRGLPSEADDVLADYYETDVFALVHDYVHSTTKRAAYQSEYGTSGGADRLDQVLNRPDVQGEVRKNPKKYNTATPAGRLNIIKDLANHKTDDLKEILLNEALKEGTASETILQLRSTIESVTGRTPRAKIVGYGDRLATAVYVIGTLALLPKAVWTAVAEPATFVLRTGEVKLATKVLGLYAREAFRGAKSVKELAALAEMVGVVSSPLHDTLMLNRMGDGNDKSTGSVVLSRFFRATFLSQVTNAQRRAVLAGSFYWMRDLAKTVQEGSGIKAKMARAEFRDVGVAEDDIDAFTKWLAARDGLPSLDDLNTSEGKQFAASSARFVDQTIQNPRRADKAQAVLTPMGRLAFGLTSFIYTFYRNVHAATVLRANRNAAIRQSEGQSKMAAVAASYGEQGARLAAGFATIFAAQMLAGIPRALVFDGEQWDEKEKEGQLGEWLGGLAASRTGALGVLDVVYNAMTGLRYERDLTSMAAGAHLGYFISQIQNVVSMFGARNSPNTNTAERTAAKGLYRLMAAPAFSALLAGIPAAGPVSKTVRFGVLEYLTSNTAGSAFATAVAGPKKAK